MQQFLITSLELKELFRLFLGFGFFSSSNKLNFCDFLGQNKVIAKLMSSNFVFWLIIFFFLADNDTDISKAHLNKAQQIIKVDFYLHLQNTENYALSALRVWIHSETCTWHDKNIQSMKQFMTLFFTCLNVAKQLKKDMLLARTT